MKFKIILLAFMVILLGTGCEGSSIVSYNPAAGDYERDISVDGDIEQIPADVDDDDLHPDEDLDVTEEESEIIEEDTSEDEESEEDGEDEDGLHPVCDDNDYSNLMWLPGEVLDHENPEEVFHLYLTLDEAIEYCENLEHDGYYDWRLPTVNELRSILDPDLSCPEILECGFVDSCLQGLVSDMDTCLRYNPCGKLYDHTDHTVGYGDPDLVDNRRGYWSSTPSHEEGKHWNMNFNLGVPRSIPLYTLGGEEIKGAATCVRDSNAPRQDCNPNSVCCDSEGYFLPSTTDCDDNEPCTYADKCNGAGICAGFPYSCNDHGTCNQSDGFCTCDNPYMNDDCSDCRYGYIDFPDCRDDPCDPDPCNANGSCSQSDGSCTCDTGFTGTFCHQCDPDALGEYPYCFLPNTAFCATSQCFGVPPTNQESCYDNEALMTCPGEAGSETSGEVDYCGQDAQYPDAARTYTCYAAEGNAGDCSMMIPVATDEVVTDSLTGLMWQRMYASPRKWANALTYCEDLDYGGHSDWRLPSVIELMSIVDDGTYNPSIDTDAFRGTPSDFFWTSTHHQTSADGVRYVKFSNGIASYFRDTQGARVRCVREGYAGSVNGTFEQFAVSGESEQVVTSMVTGLIWQKTNTTDKTWSEAMAYCESLNYAGDSDWRLPNKKELLSLVNYELVSPCSDFPNMPSAGFWSSSTDVEDVTSAWNVGLGGGDVYFRAKTDPYNVRCVRGEP